MQTRIATIKIEVPYFKKEQGSLFATFHVKGMIRTIEDMLINYITSEHKIRKPEKGTRYDEAKFLLGELKKFYFAEAANVETLPEEVK